MLNKFQWYRKLRGGYWVYIYRHWNRVLYVDYYFYVQYGHKGENWTPNKQEQSDGS